MGMGMTNLGLGMSMTRTTLTYQNYLNYVTTSMTMMIYLYEG